MPEKRLTKTRKKELDAIITSLDAALRTPEGIAVFERLEELIERIQNRIRGVEQVRPPLSESESRALAFIERQLRKGHSPSTREVTKAIGLRSSRSGHKVVHSLRRKGLLPDQVVRRTVSTPATKGRGE